MTRQLRLIVTTEFSVLHIFFSLAKGKMPSAGLTQAAIEEYVATESAQAFEEVREFIHANGMDQWGMAIKILEGTLFKAITQVMGEPDPPLLIIGTHNRTGLKKALLGSFTEDVLRRLQEGVFVAPPE